MGLARSPAGLKRIVDAKDSAEDSIPLARRRMESTFPNSDCSLASSCQSIVFSTDRFSSQMADQYPQRSTSLVLVEVRAGLASGLTAQIRCNERVSLTDTGHEIHWRRQPVERRSNLYASAHRRALSQTQGWPGFVYPLNNKSSKPTDSNNTAVFNGDEQILYLLCPIGSL